MVVGRVGDDELMTTDNGDAMDLDDGGTDGGGQESGGEFGVARREGGEMTVRAVIAVLVMMLVIVVVMMEIEVVVVEGRRKASRQSRDFLSFSLPKVGEIFSLVFSFPLGGCD